MRHLRLFLLVLGAGITSLRAEPSVVWMPTTAVFYGWQEFQTVVDIGRSGNGAPSSPSWEFAVCSVADPDCQACLSFLWKDSRDLGALGGERARRGLDPLHEGEFLGAIIVDGRRVSNVCRWTVLSPAARLLAAPRPPPPVVTLVPLSPAAGGRATHLGCRIVPPPGGGLDLSFYAAAFPELEVAGRWHPVSGSILPLPSGQVTARICPLALFDLPEGEATASLGPLVRLRIADHVSQAVNLLTAPDDAKAFDYAFGLR